MTSLAATLALSTLSANAQETFTAGKPQVGARIGYGIFTGEDRGDGLGVSSVWGPFNPYGFALGVAGGYTLDMNLHLGASFEYYLGAVEEDAEYGETVSRTVWNLMLEPGYDIAVEDAFAVRPQLGLGLSSSSVEVCETVLPPYGTGGEVCTDYPESRFAFALGAMLLVDFGGLYGQAGFRYHHVRIHTTALLLNIGAGATF